MSGSRSNRRVLLQAEDNRPPLMLAAPLVSDAMSNGPQEEEIDYYDLRERRVPKLWSPRGRRLSSQSNSPESTPPKPRDAPPMRVAWVGGRRRVVVSAALVCLSVLAILAVWYAAFHRQPPSHASPSPADDGDGSARQADCVLCASPPSPDIQDTLLSLSARMSQLQVSLNTLMDRRVPPLEARVVTLDARISSVTAALDRRILELDQTLGAMEAKIASRIASEVARATPEIAALRRDLIRLEKTTSSLVNLPPLPLPPREDLAANVLGSAPDHALARVGGRVIESWTGGGESTALDSDMQSALPIVSALHAVWRGIAPLPSALHKYRTLSNAPSIAINPSLNPGDCWAFAGSSAKFTVQVLEWVRPTAFTIDHLSRKIALQPGSAPRTYHVYGLRAGPEDRVLLVEGRYDTHDWRCVQTTSVDTQVAPKEAFKIFQLEILDNHGADYTCLYRFRVHGDVWGGPHIETVMGRGSSG